MEIVSQILGWIGTFLIVLAYFVVSFKKMTADSRGYQLMNLFGAIALGINVFYKQAWPVLALEVVWGIIALLALLKKPSV